MIVLSDRENNLLCIGRGDKISSQECILPETSRSLKENDLEIISNLVIYLRHVSFVQYLFSVEAINRFVCVTLFVCLLAFHRQKSLIRK